MLLPVFMKGVGFTAAILLVVVTFAVLIRSLFAREEVSLQRPPMAAVRAETREAEPDASSEVGGTYYGLCRKNSIRTVEDFRRTVAQDVTLSAHFAGFNWEDARVGALDTPLWTYVSYRKNDVIRRTLKPVLLPRGDGYITDGVRTVRTFCCNDYLHASPPLAEGVVEPDVSTDRVDGPSHRASKGVERVDGPALQLSSGAAYEESAGAIPTSVEKISYYSVPYYSGTLQTPTDGPFKVYTSSRREPLATPEPGTLYLMGGGVAAIALLRLLRRKRGA